jgi:3-methyladenine DNA glycosylase AlkD
MAPAPAREIAAAAGAARAALSAMARPSGEFDASRYFRGARDLGFYNVGTTAVRALARSIEAEHPDWSIADAMAFADTLLADRHLEVKAIAVELVARYRRWFSPALLPPWKRWLAAGQAANWATTDGICSSLIGPTLVRFPAAATALRGWAAHRVLWVRRAAIVGLIPLARRGQALDQVYETARQLHADREDLIEKAGGWALREAGRTDAARLERYLRAHGPAIPRTTVRYAIERFPLPARRRLLEITRAAGAARGRGTLRRLGVGLTAARLRRRT